MSTELVKACGGSPARVPGAAKLLHDVGIPLLVDLIAGLPGDTVDEVAQSCKIAGRFVRNAMKCHKRDR
jgi:coproporphyrinogen III oxidase-like Fe-S oxidoreductase